jgi:hypothetical protein
MLRCTVSTKPVLFNKYRINHYHPKQMYLSRMTGALLKLTGTEARHEENYVQMWLVARTFNKWPNSLTDDDYECYSVRYSNACKLSIRPEEKEYGHSSVMYTRAIASHVALSVRCCASAACSVRGLSALSQLAGLLWYSWFLAESRRNGRWISTYLRQVWCLLAQTCILLNALS